MPRHRDLRGVVPRARTQGHHGVRAQVAQGGVAAGQPRGREGRAGAAGARPRARVHAQSAARRQASRVLRRPLHPAAGCRDRRHRRLQR